MALPFFLFARHGGQTQPALSWRHPDQGEDNPNRKSKIGGHYVFFIINYQKEGKGQVCRWFLVGQVPAFSLFRVVAFVCNISYAMH